ncbi:hypothetical protein OZX61_02285 [Acinetobacter sp. ESL0695]|uniref:immunity protein YezG family protein n=1 Tax=Acinetobacter sp. ESL0695 TaxID=2983215 RepID=UPI0023F59614|nr:hypothetical protein [Acinetobacter sp. ESL0695]WEV49337.1 hypothetical protein OZX61_02285 [Acinetobacter sp. ESL0695]
MNDQQIYQKIGELLWSIMAEEAIIIFCTGTIYSDSNSYSFRWFTQNGEKKSFDFYKMPNEIGDQIIVLMEELRCLDIFVEKWTHFKISLTDDEKFNIDFAYIPEEDSWVSLYMKGISDLSEEELDQDYPQIPKELWRERVKLKDQNVK